VPVRSRLSPASRVEGGNTLPTEEYRTAQAACLLGEIPTFFVSGSAGVDVPFPSSSVNVCQEFPEPRERFERLLLERRGFLTQEMRARTSFFTR